MNHSDLLNLIPPEFESAKNTLRAASRDARLGAGGFKAQIGGFIFMFLIGTVSGFLFISYGLIKPEVGDFWRAGATALSVLSGFMIATMVFTGKIEAAKSLSLSELRIVSGKINYLLLYQLGTLINHLLSILLMLVVPLVGVQSYWGGIMVGTLCCSFFFVSISRSMLIPIQVIEIHRFTHAALLRDKKNEVSSAAEGM
ncbi:hypothetical protein [Xanthomonas arboricola]|uniref:hypothetical protein n=1 Tax=Xanthomonas arboricola TaxID=56448 RepID=UPI0011B0EBF7|nr:hypothetical protein [Xanthomonas arboricola]